MTNFDASGDRGEAAAADLWMIHAVIQPFRLDAVTLALEAIPGFGGMTVLDCRGFGRGKLMPRKLEDDEGEGDASSSAPARPITSPEQGTAVTDFTRKIKLEIAVAGRTEAAAIAETIARHAHTGRRGDGKVFVWPLARAVRVRTFAEDANAL